MSQLDVEGKFRARAMSADLGRAGTGTEQVGVNFAVIDGEHTGKDITAYLYLTPGALPYTVKSLRNAGWQGDDLSDLSTVGSQDCEIVVQWEEYNGTDTLKVQYINSLDGGGGVAMKDKMTPEERKAFAAKMKGAVIAASKATGGSSKPAKPTTPKPAPRKPAPPSEDAPPVDDDVPF